MRAPLAFVAVAFGLGIGLFWALRPSALALWVLAALLLFLNPLPVKRYTLNPAMAHLRLLALVMILGAARAWVDAQVPADSVAHYLTATSQPMTWSL